MLTKTLHEAMASTPKKIEAVLHRVRTGLTVVASTEPDTRSNDTYGVCAVKQTSLIEAATYSPRLVSLTTGCGR